MACAVQSATTTNTDSIAMPVSTATATCEATVLETGTDLMALAGWLLLGLSTAQLVHPGVGAEGNNTARVTTYKNGEVGECERF